MKKKITQRKLTTIFLSGALLFSTLLSSAAVSAEYLLDDGESVYTEEGALTYLPEADIFSEETPETKSDAPVYLPDASSEAEVYIENADAGTGDILISDQPDEAQDSYYIESSLPLGIELLVGQTSFVIQRSGFKAVYDLDEAPYFKEEPVQVKEISLGDLNPAGCATLQEVKDSSTGEVTGWTITGVKKGTGTLYAEIIDPEGKTQKNGVMMFGVVNDLYNLSVDMNDRNNAMFPGAEKGAHAVIEHQTAGGNTAPTGNVTYEWSIADGFDPLVTITRDPHDNGSNSLVLIKASQNVSSSMEYVMLTVAAYDLDSGGKRVKVAEEYLDVIITKRYTIISPENINPDAGFEDISVKPAFYYCWQDAGGNHQELMTDAVFQWDYDPEEVSILNGEGKEAGKNRYSYGTTFTIRRKSGQGAYFMLDAQGSYAAQQGSVSARQNYTLNKIDEGKVPVTGVKLDKTNIAMSIDTTDTLTATISPANATNKNVKWTSSDPTVVSVDSTGKITALKDGFAKITVTTEDGNKTAVSNVTVKTPTVTMYRVYNPYTGEHLYTTNAKERDDCVKRGWKDEGVAWNSPTSGDIAVYRLYNPKKGYEQHHYTADQNEINILVKDGWKKEGIAWFSKKGKVIPIYRAFYPAAKNPAACHHLTKDAHEYKVITTQQGWKPEGIAFYAIS